MDPTNRDLEAMMRLHRDSTGPLWRVGTKVGRTVYKGYASGDLIGVMDRREDARLVCVTRNWLPAAVGEIASLRTVAIRAERLLNQSPPSQFQLELKLALQDYLRTSEHTLLALNLLKT